MIQLPITIKEIIKTLNEIIYLINNYKTYLFTRNQLKLRLKETNI